MMGGVVDCNVVMIGIGEMERIRLFDGCEWKGFFQIKLSGDG
jgi:hypothetical protein